MKLQLGLVSLLHSAALILAAEEECPPLVLETQFLSHEAKAGRVTTLRLKLQALSLPAPADVVLQVTLPPGVVLQTARQRGGRTVRKSWTQEGLFEPSKTRTDVTVEVEVDECPPDPLTFDIVTYIGNSSYCYTSYPSKTLAIIPGHKFCP